MKPRLYLDSEYLDFYFYYQALFDQLIRIGTTTEEAEISAWDWASRSVSKIR